MRALFTQKLPLSGRSSFVARTFRTPEFEVGWHQHVEIELILFTEGEGQYYIGNSAGTYQTGDIFLLGSNLPHTFQKSGPGIASAVVVQFKPDFWGADFLHLPEMESITALFRTSLQGLRIHGATREALTAPIKALELQQGFNRILLLGACLQQIAKESEWQTVSTQELTTTTLADKERLERVFRFSFDHFREPISLNQVAGLAALSVPAFCHYFRKRTKKTYIDFLNEIRISYACKQLMTTTLTVAEIGFESGYNTPAHFFRQFRRHMGRSPGEYKRQMSRE